MRRRCLVLVLTIMAAALMPATVSAADFRGGNDVVIGPDQTIDEDLYFAGNSLRVLGTVKGDVFAAGQSIVVEGLIEGGLTAAGSSISVNGKVLRGIRAAGNDISVNGQVGRDLMAAGAFVRLGPNGKIGSDLSLAAGNATVSGQVARDVRGSVSQIRIDGQVARNIILDDAQTLELAASARVGGSLRYRSPNEASISAGSVVGGERVWTPARAEQETARPASAIFEFLWGLTRSFIGLAVLGLLWVVLLPRTADVAERTLERRPIASFGIGLLILLVAPLAIALLLVLALVAGTGQVLVVGGALLAIGGALSGVVIALEIGDRLLERLGQSTEKRWLVLLVGVAIVSLIASLPVVGWLFTGLTLVLGLGALALPAIRATAPGRQKDAASDLPLTAA